MFKSLLFIASIALVEGADLLDVELHVSEAKLSINPRYRPQYHISAPVGWINDPDGFVFYKGNYHMFFQYYPYIAYRGSMHWGHVASPNLLDWSYLPTALQPDQPYDDDGCFSGSAIEHDGQLVIMYSSNIYYNETEIRQAQSIAFSSNGITFDKYSGNPVIYEVPDDVYAFRDPKVWKRGDNYYVVIGTKTPDSRGRLVYYKSFDLIAWEFVSIIAEGEEDMGFMWECPDIFDLDGETVLLFSPQGLESDGEKFKNIYQTGYIISDFDYETGKFSKNISLNNFRELDYGFDFYATQTTLTDDGRRIVIAWMNAWESDYVEAVDGWAGVLTLPRELNIDENGNMLMNPIREAVDLRLYTVRNKNYKPGEKFPLTAKAVELEISGGNPNSESVYGIELDLGNSSISILWYDDKMTMNRGGNDSERSALYKPVDKFYWRIFVDACSIEVFCGHGEAVMTSRMFPTDIVVLNVTGNKKLKIVEHLLRCGIHY